MGPVRSNKPELLRVGHARSRPIRRVGDKTGGLTVVKMPHHDVVQDAEAKQRLLLRSDPPEDTDFAHALEEVLAQEGAIQEALQEIERHQKEIHASPPDLAVFLDEVLAQHGWRKRQVDWDKQAAASTLDSDGFEKTWALDRQESEDDLLECDVLMTEEVPPLEYDEASELLPQRQFDSPDFSLPQQTSSLAESDAVSDSILEDTACESSSPLETADPSSFDEERLCQEFDHSEQENAFHHSLSRQSKNVCIPQQDILTSPDENPEAVWDNDQTQEFKLDENLDVMYWGEDTTNDPFDGFEQSLEDLCTQEFSLEDVLQEADLERNTVVDFGNAFRHDARTEDLSALTQEFTAISSDKEPGLPTDSLSEEVMESTFSLDETLPSPQEAIPSEQFLDADYVDLTETYSETNETVEDLAALQDVETPIGDAFPLPPQTSIDQAVPAEEYTNASAGYVADQMPPEPSSDQFPPHEATESTQSYAAYTDQPAPYYASFPEHEFAPAEPAYVKFLPRWVKTYERCSFVVFVLCIVLLITSSFVYMMDGAPGRQAFGLAYYPIHDSVEAAQTNGAERLTMTNLGKKKSVAIDQSVVVRLSNLSGVKETVFLLQKIIEINGDQYYTDQGYTLNISMIQGTPMFRLPSWMRALSLYFMPILIIVLGLLLVRWMFQNFFLYDVYKKAQIQAGEYTEEQGLQQKRSKPKLLLGFLLNGLFVALVVLLVVVFASGGQRSLFGYYYFSVLTTSMQADIPQGSLVFVKQVDPATIQVGDDITFMQEGDKIITHRVIEVLENYGTNGERAFRTKGTANEMADQDVVYDVNVLGKVISHIEDLGATMLYIQKNAVLFGILLVGLLLFIFFVKKALRVPSQEEEENTGYYEYYGEDPNASFAPYPTMEPLDGVDPPPVWEQVSSQNIS